MNSRVVCLELIFPQRDTRGNEGTCFLVRQEKETVERQKKTIKVEFVYFQRKGEIQKGICPIV